jgi:hypothetical protein
VAKPNWLRVEVVPGDQEEVRRVLREQGLATVCESARCPNLPTCWGKGTATFMILGEICTRFCRFCAVSHGKPNPPDPTEPERLARAVKALGLRYVVLTSVDRDDLPDGGASHFASCIRRSRRPRRKRESRPLFPIFPGILRPCGPWWRPSRMWLATTLKRCGGSLPWFATAARATSFLSLSSGPSKSFPPKFSRNPRSFWDWAKRRKRWRKPFGTFGGRCGHRRFGPIFAAYSPRAFGSPLRFAGGVRGLANAGSKVRLSRCPRRTFGAHFFSCF